MKISFFVSDEGYGHVMRQKNIISLLLSLSPSIDITIFTKSKIDLFHRQFENSVDYVELFNLVQTAKDSSGNLDLVTTREFFEMWTSSVDLWLESAEKHLPSSTCLLVSDSVPQVTMLGKKLNIPVMFVQHFTWDWLYHELFGEDRIFQQLNYYYSLGSKIYFPPLTPDNNIKLHPHTNIGYIVNQELINLSHKSKSNPSGDKINILLMNNGTNSMISSISDLVQKMPRLDNVFYHLRNNSLTEKAQYHALLRDDIVFVEELHEIHLAISSSDIVVARGGYNSISELVVLGKSSIIVDEARNPEIQSNLLLACKQYKNIKGSSRHDIMENLLTLIEKYRRPNDLSNDLSLATGCLDMSNHIINHLSANS